MLEKLVPKKFLCKYPLSVGALLGGITFIVVAVLCIIGLLVRLLTSPRGSDVTWVTAFSFTVTGILYHLLLILVDSWMIWAVSQKKSSILLSWVILSAMWLAQTWCVLVVMILLRRSEVAVGVWITYLVLTVVLTCGLAYLVLVVCGLWLELKGVRRTRTQVEAHNEDI